ncbi:hypothetical protein Golob_020931 [Gossypium lobatum]|uniref:DUF4283 domain-containing protein n=1 Tax=Gossypium lobatum TaxID=34289 RepID=A0A7J8LBX6_9ROSI|nr:hypothetical protein [Gossypium lobatum]
MSIEDSGGFRSSEDRATKKVRFKGTDGEEGVDMIVDMSSEPMLSWKDRLRDVMRSTVNGVLSIMFSNRVQRILPSMPFKLIDVEHGYFSVKFQSNDDSEKELTQEPCVVFGQYLTVQPWMPDFNPLQLFPNVVMTWIRLPGLLGFLYKRKILEEIGGFIGRVVKLDYNRNSRNGHMKALCPHSVENLDHPREKEVVSVGNIEGKEEEAFGPWMVVNQKSCVNGVSGQNKRIGETDMAKHGPRLEGVVATSSLGGSSVGVELGLVLGDSVLHQEGQSTFNMVYNNFPVSGQNNKVHLDSEIAENSDPKIKNLSEGSGLGELGEGYLGLKGRGSGYKGVFV